MTRRAGFLWGLVTLAVGCATPDEPVATDPGDDAELKGDGLGSAAPLAPTGQTVRLQVDHGAYPSTETLPNVVVYIPHGFDKTAPLEVVVFLHGWYNCADNVVKARNSVCTPGRTSRNAYNLAGQLEDSKRNAILVVPELAFDAASGDPGAFAEPDTFFHLLDDTLVQLGDKVNNDSLWDVDQIIVASHSGGYQSAAMIVSQGGLWVNELWLLDSLYDHFDEFDGWVNADDDDNDNKDLFATHERRFASVYSLTGGTLAYSQAMADRAKGWFDTTTVFDDRTTATLAAANYAKGLIFKRSGLPHDDIPRYYFSRLLATSGLPAKP